MVNLEPCSTREGSTSPWKLFSPVFVLKTTTRQKWTYQVKLAKNQDLSWVRKPVFTAARSTPIRRSKRNLGREAARCNPAQYYSIYCSTSIAELSRELAIFESQNSTNEGFASMDRITTGRWRDRATEWISREAIGSTTGRDAFPSVLPDRWEWKSHRAHWWRWPILFDHGDDNVINDIDVEEGQIFEPAEESQIHAKTIRLELEVLNANLRSNWTCRT